MKGFTKIGLTGLIVFAALLFFSPLSMSAPSYTWDWSNNVNFGLSSYGTKISFDNDILLGNFTFYDTAIKYNDILLDTHVDTITLGTQVSNMTVTHLVPLRFDYNVTGGGTQTINNGNEPDSVFLDGTQRIEGMGYTYNDGTKLLTVTGATQNATIIYLDELGPQAVPTGYQSALFQYLLEGDFLGFVLACYTSTIGSIFYAICVFFVSSIIYLRQKSLFTVSLIWLFVGGTFIALFWEFSFVAVWFTLLGIAGIVAEFILVWRQRR